MQRDGRFLGWIPSTSTNLIVVERALAGRTEKGAAQSSHFAAAPVLVRRQPLALLGDKKALAMDKKETPR
jgi:hypothetical protein